MGLVMSLLWDRLAGPHGHTVMCSMGNALIHPTQLTDGENEAQRREERAPPRPQRVRCWQSQHPVTDSRSGVPGQETHGCFPELLREDGSILPAQSSPSLQVRQGDGRRRRTRQQGTPLVYRYWEAQYESISPVPRTTE